jgi:hypothetical protein
MIKEFFIKNKKRILIITIIAVLVCVLVLPYIKAEYYTNKYGKQFKDLYGNKFEALYELTGWVESVEFYRVVDYSENSAKIYYAEAGGQTTYYLWFSRDNKDSDWTLSDYKVLWAKYGNADDWPWPFYFKEQIFC